MPTRRRLVGRITMCLLLIVVAAACGPTGRDLHIEIDNTDGPQEVTVTVDSSALGMAGGEDLKVARGEGAGWSVPLGSTWEVKVDGNHVIGSGEGLPSPGQGQDVTIQIRVDADGTVRLLDAP